MRAYKYIPYATYIQNASRRSLPPAMKDVLCCANSFILMHNFVAETYQTGVLISIVENKKKYKFVSGLISNILGIQRGYDEIVKENAMMVSGDALLQLDDMSDNLQDGLSKELSVLQKSVDEKFIELGCNDKVLSMLYVSRKLVEVASSTYNCQIGKLNYIDGRMSGIMSWMSFSKMLSLYDRIQCQLGINKYFDKVDSDLTIISKLSKVKNLMNDSRFVATHMGIDTTDSYENSYVEILSKHNNKS